METPPDVRYVMRDGRSIAFQKWGSGTRRLVFVNQATVSLDLVWAEGYVHDALVEAGERAECVMYDQLGQGLSDPVDHVPTLEQRTADLGAVLDVAGFKSATISAIFDACLPVIVFAAQYPERVDSLVLFNPFSQGWLAASPEELVGWRDAEQVRGYTRVGPRCMTGGAAVIRWRCRCPRWQRAGTFGCGRCSSGPARARR